jgi:hypothetical protein
MDSFDKLIIENDYLFKRNQGKRILFATGFSGYNHGAIVDKIISTAIFLRGSTAEFYICDEFLPTCMLTKIKQIIPSELAKSNKQPRCKDCFSNGKKYLQHLKVKKHYFSEYVSGVEILEIEKIIEDTKTEDILKFHLDGINIGEEVYAGTLRYFGREEIENEEFKNLITKKFFKSALLTKISFTNLLDKNKFDCVVYSHGIYVPHGIINQILKKKSIRNVVYIPSYRKNTFIFSHNDTYHKTMPLEDNSKWNNLNLSKKQNTELDKYLFSRRSGLNDWIFFNKDNFYDFNKIALENNIDKKKKIVLLLTNVIWDARLHYESNAFSSMIEWLTFTIDYYKNSKHVQLVIRIHPAELTGDVPSRQKVEDEIKKKFTIIPENIKMIKPENPASTYTLIENSNLVLIYNTKTGIEAAAMGKKVLVAGEAWIRNKDFSFDATSKKDYLNKLENIDLSKDLSQYKLFLAKKYAYHIFFRRMIQLNQISVNNFKNNKFDINIKSIFELTENYSKELDTICNGILNGKDFICDNQNFKTENKSFINFQYFKKKIFNYLRFSLL